MTTRKTFTPAFKLEIAKLMVDENYTIKQACEASGAGETAVKRWRQQYLAELAGKPMLFSRKNAAADELPDFHPMGVLRDWKGGHSFRIGDA